MREYGLFQVTDLGDGIYFIVDRSMVGMYLVEGTEKAALIDCGTGLGDLRECISTLTDKPVELLATHGHADHIGGACNFDRIYISGKDKDLLFDGIRLEKRLQFAEAVRAGTQDDSWNERDLVENKPLQLLYVNPGDSFELGGRTLTAIDMQGHTKGSTGYFDDRTGTLFAGDGCNNSTFVFGEESASISRYRETLWNVKKELGKKYKRHAICHDYSFAPLECIDNVIECCDIILSGQADNERFPERYRAIGIDPGPIVWAKAGGADRTDGRFGNIAYDIRRVE